MCPNMKAVAKHNPLMTQILIGPANVALREGGWEFGFEGKANIQFIKENL